MSDDPKARPANDDEFSAESASGRVGGGESGGGAFKDPSLVPTKPGSYDGGQSQRKYSGTGDAGDDDDNPNAVADHD